METKTSHYVQKQSGYTTTYEWETDASLENKFKYVNLMRKLPQLLKPVYIRQPYSWLRLKPHDLWGQSEIVSKKENLPIGLKESIEKS